MLAGGADDVESPIVHSGLSYRDGEDARTSARRERRRVTHDGDTSKSLLSLID
jgi:hypothetical protein